MKNTSSRNQVAWSSIGGVKIRSPAVHSALAFLLEHLPPNLHLVIGSREDPPLPLARLRARGQIAELGAKTAQKGLTIVPLKVLP